VFQRVYKAKAYERVNIPRARTQTQIVRKRWPRGSKNVYEKNAVLRHPRGHLEFLSVNVQKGALPSRLIFMTTKN
jgi:hypothetical protein